MRGLLLASLVVLSVRQDVVETADLPNVYLHRLELIYICHLQLCFDFPYLKKSFKNFLHLLSGAAWNPETWLFPFARHKALLDMHEN